MRGYATARRYVARYVKEQRLIEIPLEKRRLGKVPIVPCDTGSLASLDPLALDEFFASRAVEEEWAEAERSLAAFDVPEATSGVNPGDRRAVYYLARWLKPASILEVGTSVGASMVHLALALRRLREETGSAVGLTTVDNRAVNDPVSRPWRQAGTSHSPREMAEGLGCGDFVTFVTDTSMSYLSAPGRPGFDLIFLDGSHAAATVYKEVPAALSLLNAGGTLLMHDYFPGLEPLWPNGRVIPGPYLAVERLKSEGADLEVLPLGSLPWATKLGTNITSLALLSRGRATS